MAEFRICTTCGYRRGFHVHFRETADSGVVIGLICPNCGQSYELGWREGDVTTPLTVTPGPVYPDKG
jgi:transcription elongation factor Elf1